jgi:hypothetical protein
MAQLGVDMLEDWAVVPDNEAVFMLNSYAVIVLDVID